MSVLVVDGRLEVCKGGAHKRVASWYLSWLWEVLFLHDAPKQRAKKTVFPHIPSSLQRTHNLWPLLLHSKDKLAEGFIFAVRCYCLGVVKVQ